MSTQTTIFLAKGGGWRFPKILENGGIQRVFFTPGLNVVDDEDLFDQVCAHPDVDRMEAEGIIKFYDGRKESKPSNLGLELTDLKGVEDGVPVADLSTKNNGNAQAKIRKSKDTSGTKKKSTKRSGAHGSQPLPPQGE